MNEQLRGFQKRFIRGALAPGIDVAALSIPRGNGKSFLAAHVLQRVFDPWGRHSTSQAAEYLLCAGSIEQARIWFSGSFVLELEPSGELRLSGQLNAHRDCDTSVLIPVCESSVLDGKTAMGIVGCPLLVADEPGSVGG